MLKDKVWIQQKAILTIVAIASLHSNPVLRYALQGLSSRRPING
jgi:hypothetical protein